MNKFSIGFFAVIFIATACEDVKTNGGSGGAGGTGAAGGSAGNGGTGGSGGMSNPAVCPVTEPTMGDACATPDLHCSYGEGAFPMCRHRYRCDAGVWATFSAFCDMEPAPCAPSPPDGAACPGQTSYCVDGTRLCMCPVCGGAGCPPEPWSWSCSSAPAMGCPALVPNEGTACSDPTLDCEYGIMCNEHARARCTNGLWIWDEDMPCP
jgi:hypothetical protein